MKTLNQVCTIEQAKRLKELGVVQPEELALFYNDIGGLTRGKGPEAFGNYAAFTVAELGIMITTSFDLPYSFGQYNTNEPSWLSEKMGTEFSTEAECRADLLIFLIETGCIDADYCNERLAS